MSEYHGPAGRFKRGATASSELSATALLDHPSRRRLDRQPVPASERRISDTADTMPGPLTLLPNQIEAPAFFVDDTLSIRWIADGGTDLFSRSLSHQLKTSGTRNVFNLIMRPAIKHALDDWQAFFSFVYATLRRFTTQDGVDDRARFISREGIARPENDAAKSEAPFEVDSCLIDGSATGDSPPLRLFGLRFGQGTLFLLRSDRWRDRSIPIGKPAPTAIAERSIHEKQLIAILSARLHRSHHLADVLLPELFFKMMSRIWEEADGVVRSLGGKRVDCRGGQICFVFGESAGRNPVFSAICCATRLNGQMALLEEKLRVQQGWSNEILLNMGISHGSDDPLGADPRNSMEFVIPGGAFDQSTQLSTLAGKGEVWITKAAVARLPKQFVDQLVLGIDREGRFQRNCFVPIGVLQGREARGEPAAGRNGFSVARLAKLDKSIRVSGSTDEE